jgi:hypothetical protein
MISTFTKERFMGKVSTQEAANQDAFDSMPIGTIFSVRHNRTGDLKAVYKKLGEFIVRDIGDGREWRRHQIGDLSSRYYLQY